MGEDPAASFRSRHAAELLALLDDPFDNLLRALDLVTPPAGLPLPDFDAVADSMRAPARSALVAMTPEELGAFADDYEAADHRTARRTLHRVVVMPSLCAVIDGFPLPAEFRRRLERVRTGGSEGDAKACGATSAP
jgi:hypothetical protein